NYDPVQMAEYAAKWEQKTDIAHTCWLPGVGDHGGGPTRDMLLKARRWRESPFFPQVKFSTPKEFLHEAMGSPVDLPVWDDELYLELHRGCYTVHSDQKQKNRRGEDLLYQAEVWATVAQLVSGQPYPQETLETAWKGLLFNQFHDILPGTSIPQVFEDANEEWAKVDALGRSVLEQSLAALSVQGTVGRGKPLQVFNALSWSRTEVVTVAVPLGPWQIIDCETNQLVDHVVYPAEAPFAGSPADQESQVLSFLAHDVPAVGYRLYALVAGTTEVLADVHTEKYILENACLRVVVSPKTGEIISCIHLATGREILSSAANQLQCFEDSGQYWDAWNIAPDYADKPCASAQLISIEWISRNPICHRLRVTRQLNQSTLVQDYCLAADAPCLNVETWVDWQETQVVLKVNFPITIASDQATYEVPFGAIDRPTKPTTEHEKAKWEVPALRWADLSDEAFGLSILTDCKHGFDAKPSQLRLTLLKAPLWPDPGCDRTHHHFTYALYPHPGNWQTAHTPHHAQALNIPLRAYTPMSSGMPAGQPASGAICRSFLSLDAEHLILAAFKPSEADPSCFIARYYDAYGIPSEGTLTNSLGLTVGAAVNLLEEPIESLPVRPYQIQTRCLVPEKLGEA
ncbi:alpha-mannosidase, partial [Leptolyngbya cf. ectocarpi LEGE 11479]